MCVLLYLYIYNCDAISILIQIKEIRKCIYRKHTLYVHKEVNPVLNPTLELKNKTNQVIYNQTGILWINCFRNLIIFNHQEKELKIKIKYRDSCWSTNKYKEEELIVQKQSTFDIERGLFFITLGFYL